MKMKKLILGFAAFMIVSGCNFTADKKQSGSFFVNGAVYKVGEDGVSVIYVNANTLQVQLTAGSGQTFSASFRLDLSKIDTQMAIDSAADGVYYIGANSAVHYLPTSGSYQITSYKEGSPVNRHTEGVFDFTAVNQYDASDTVRISDGYFYLNNY